MINFKAHLFAFNPFQSVYLKAFLLIFISAVGGYASAPETTRYEGIKMGIEVEIVNPIKYVRQDGEKSLRHKKLLIATHGGEEVWRLEVDSSNQDIEFVSVPFALPHEYAKLEATAVSINQFIRVLQAALMSESLAHIDPELLARINSDIADTDVNIDFHPEYGKTSIPLAIVSAVKDGIVPKPQITYQIPLETLFDLFSYFIAKKGEFETGGGFKEKLSGYLINEKKATCGFLNLISYYIYNIGRVETLYRKVPGIFELNKSKNTETGIKQYIPIMSRLAFSDIYKALQISGLLNEEEYLAKLTERMDLLEIKEDAQILEFDYGIMRNPLFIRRFPPEPSPFIEGGRLSSFYPYPLLNTDLMEKDYRLGQWLASIRDPSIPRPLGRPVALQDTAPARKATKEEMKASIYAIRPEDHGASEAEQTIYIKSQLRRYLESQFVMHSNGKDLLSPAPYSVESDSMGALDIRGIDLNFGLAVLEIRKYGEYYKTIHKTDLINNLEDFLLNEAAQVMKKIILANLPLFNASLDAETKAVLTKIESKLKESADK